MSNGSERKRRAPAARAESQAPDGAASVSPDIAAVAAFLRVLADQVERDAPFGKRVRALAEDSGLFAPSRPVTSGGRAAKAPPDKPRTESADVVATLDLFSVLRVDGEARLRARLGEMDVPALHRLIRGYRLDPARISARWSDRDRLISLILDQVRARSDHGKAFARV
jgi:hypothetical protein